MRILNSVVLKRFGDGLGLFEESGNQSSFTRWTVRVHLARYGLSLAKNVNIKAAPRPPRVFCAQSETIGARSHFLQLSMGRLYVITYDDELRGAHRHRRLLVIVPTAPTPPRTSWSIVADVSKVPHFLTRFTWSAEIQNLTRPSCGIILPFDDIKRKVISHWSVRGRKLVSKYRNTKGLPVLHTYIAQV